MVVAKINNIDCTKVEQLSEAAQLLVEAEGTVTILAHAIPIQTTRRRFHAAAPATPPMELSRYVTATVELHEEDAIGLEFTDKTEKGKKEGHGGETSSSFVEISSVDHEGPFFTTPLRSGMKVIQINNQVVTSAAQAMVLVMTAVTKNAVDNNTKATNSMVTILALQAKGRFPPGAFATVVLEKKTRDTRVGATLGMRNDQCVIAGIRDGTPAALTPLETGMIVCSINNYHTHRKTSVQVARLLAEEQGTIAILVQVPPGWTNATRTSTLVTAVMVKKDAKYKLGIAFERLHKKIVISKIMAGSPTSKTDLRVGMTVLQINDQSVQDMSAAEAAGILVQSPAGIVTVLAQKHEIPKDSYVTVVVTKESNTSKVGATLGMQNGACVVSNIAEGSPASKTELEVGMVVCSINNIQCANLTSAQVAQLLADAPCGTITFLAHKPPSGSNAAMNTNTSSFVTGTMQKNLTPENDDDAPKLGVTLQKSEGRILITKINEDSPAAKTDLRVGMSVLQINNHSVLEMSSAGAATLLADAPNMVTILAQRHVAPKGAYVTASFVKKRADDMVGIQLGTVTRTTSKESALCPHCECQGRHFGR
jgi:predicted metalloprotease with PDZ domain